MSYVMDVAITTMSSKGQIVIPSSFRSDLPPGEKLFLFRSGDKIIIKKASELEESLVEDLKFAEKTEQALKRYDHGEFNQKSKDDFLKELKKW